VIMWRHVDKTYLECNSAACRRPDGKNRLIHKWNEMLHVGADMYCIHCGNWIAGYDDCFGRD